MENQHQKIKGYRDLSQVEIDLMNAIKKEGPVLDMMIAAVKQHLLTQGQAAKNSDEETRIAEAEPNRWTAIAKTHFQEGLMALTRAVAQPGFF